MNIKSATYREFSPTKMVAILAVLLAFTMELALPHFFEVGDQQVLVELFGEDEPSKEDAEKDKEKEENIKLSESSSESSLYARKNVSMLRTRSELADHLHFESVPTPPPEPGVRRG